ncbi:hypothetical protein ACJZ2D_003566 [Fusarium nematophilum]
MQQGAPSLARRTGQMAGWRTAALGGSGADEMQPILAADSSPSRQRQARGCWDSLVDSHPAQRPGIAQAKPPPFRPAAAVSSPVETHMDASTHTYFDTCAAVRRAANADAETVIDAAVSPLRELDQLRDHQTFICPRASKDPQSRKKSAPTQKHKDNSITRTGQEEEVEIKAMPESTHVELWMRGPSPIAPAPTNKTDPAHVQAVHSILKGDATGLPSSNDSLKSRSSRCDRSVAVAVAAAAAAAGPACPPIPRPGAYRSSKEHGALRMEHGNPHQP